MRKSISLTALVWLLSVWVMPVFADQFGQCDVLVDDGVTKGLYGLCIAYWNAEDGKGRDRILENYLRRATGPNDPPQMPGTGTPQDLVQCPCWTETSLAEMTEGFTGMGCIDDENMVSYDMAIYMNAPSVVAFFAGYVDLFETPGWDGAICAIQSTSDGMVLLHADEDQDEVCRAGIHALVDMDGLSCL